MSSLKGCWKTRLPLVSARLVQRDDDVVELCARGLEFFLRHVCDALEDLLLEHLEGLLVGVDVRRARVVGETGKCEPGERDEHGVKSPVAGAGRERRDAGRLDLPVERGVVARGTIRSAIGRGT